MKRKTTMFLTIVAASTLFAIPIFGQSPAAGVTGPLSKQVPSDDSTAEMRAPARIVRSGLPLKSALSIFDAAGVKPAGAYQWAGTDPDSKVTWRRIADGIEIAIYYSKKSQLLTNIAMMYIPPKYDRRGNYQVIATDQIQFNTDGTYTVTFSKPLPTAKRNAPEFPNTKKPNKSN